MTTDRLPAPTYSTLYTTTFVELDRSRTVVGFHRVPAGTEICDMRCKGLPAGQVEVRLPGTLYTATVFLSALKPSR